MRSCVCVRWQSWTSAIPGTFGPRNTPHYNKLLWGTGLLACKPLMAQTWRSESDLWSHVTKAGHEAGKTAQQLNMWTALPEQLWSVPRTHITTDCNSSSRSPVASLSTCTSIKKTKRHTSGPYMCWAQGTCLQSCARDQAQVLGAEWTARHLVSSWPARNHVAEDNTNVQHPHSCKHMSIHMNT